MQTAGEVRATPNALLPSRLTKRAAAEVERHPAEVCDQAASRLLTITTATLRSSPKVAHLTSKQESHTLAPTSYGNASHTMSDPDVALVYDGAGPEAGGYSLGSKR